METPTGCPDIKIVCPYQTTEKCDFKFSSAVTCGRVAWQKNCTFCGGGGSAVTEGPTLEEGRKERRKQGTAPSDSDVKKEHPPHKVSTMSAAVKDKLADIAREV